MTVVEWLNRKELGFSQMISNLGMKFNAHGGNEIYVLDENGRHTGSGMCNIASAAIEEAATKVYPEGFKVNVVALDTRVCSFAHQVTRIEACEGLTFTADGSYRQIDRKAKGIYVFPTEIEASVYGTRSEIRQLRQGDAARLIRKELRQGMWGKITEQDFDNLVSTLIEK